MTSPQLQHLVLHQPPSLCGGCCASHRAALPRSDAQSENIALLPLKLFYQRSRMWGRLLTFKAETQVASIHPHRCLDIGSTAAQGTPEAPRCGFSARVASTLSGLGVPFGHFDILQDQAVREGLKVPLRAAFATCLHARVC